MSARRREEEEEEKEDIGMSNREGQEEAMLSREEVHTRPVREEGSRHCISRKVSRKRSANERQGLLREEFYSKGN